VGGAALLERDELLAELGAARAEGGRLVFVGGEAGVALCSGRARALTTSGFGKIWLVTDNAGAIYRIDPPAR
jgi:hypothetical protein